MKVINTIPPVVARQPGLANRRLTATSGLSSPASLLPSSPSLAPRTGSRSASAAIANTKPGAPATKKASRQPGSAASPSPNIPTVSTENNASQLSAIVPPST
ncbi:hypothetical protein ENSA5_04170 [Enhygromyxa salina]|uniref:Uncharacterized protein n=1 Tax=Enhygromyxa salina TaxID=215803 RepID=A0A2S9YJ91_9BACT|nr:hypothetical protein ENSA5_04170 [Enhygromyxa salina]